MGSASPPSYRRETSTLSILGVANVTDVVVTATKGGHSRWGVTFDGVHYAHNPTDRAVLTNGDTGHVPRAPGFLSF